MSLKKTLLIIFITGAVINGGFYIYAFSQSDQKINAALNSRFNLDKEALELAFQGENLTLSVPETGASFTVPRDIFETWLETYTRAYTRKKETRLIPQVVADYLDSIEFEVNKAAVDARFKFSGGALQTASPAQKGYALNKDASLTAIHRQLAQGQALLNLVVNTVDPEITENQINALGITALIGQGTSDFQGSSVARQHNVQTGAKRYNGTIVKPGEIFSFNDRLGRVDAASGYQYELVIKGEKLIPEYGGGICQVSTTVFRAAFYSGLPILERKAHSLPVRYYNPQGFDATIYPGVVDLRFRNNTPGHILIQTEIVDTRLTVSIFGTDDKRIITANAPEIYETSEDGALKAVIARQVVYANGEVENKSFYSNYKSPSKFERERNPLE
ncbi:MAG: hypothetical protein COV31_02935 [Candidatus Yanofskybacteria bacterium CG10_big_fil_rev_8_21_14_0_10_46_23]|uniref:YoaR-like putative peptidoglycan binding domain-containing protein n=1 Tax=Candidatus Yanofskybacteria bacterium CG10_big_fil_rev_8_21_14_0_10_46_23 TaxID=1975098 RepID=A0A2H0R3H9_9BACT|nr:MAG: hypothetical protein COV31_02935 [Candidatus Yanofskybacteria bacterium CG10_big_fil_rev_8_21_14_0_10_46_23]